MAFGDVVQSNSGTSTTATTVPTLGSATTAGNIVVLHFAADDYNGTPNAGWTQSSEMEQQVYHGAYLWWAIATAAMTIPSYSITGAFRSTWTLVEYQGPFDASPYDISQGRSFQGSHLNPFTDTITPTAGDRLLVAGLASQDATLTLSALSGPENSFTQAASSLFNGANPRLATAHLRRVVTANGSTSYSTAATQSADTDSSSGLIIAFKAGAGGGTTYNDTTAETASAADTAGGLLNTTKAVAETVAAAESISKTLTFTGAVAEAASAAETIVPIVVPAGGTLYEEAVLETLAANDEVSADVIRASVGGGIGHGGGGGKRRRHLFIYETVPSNDDDEDEDEEPKPVRKLRLKKAEVEEKIEDAIAWIEAGSPRPMAPQALAAEVSAVLDIAALLEVDRRRVERTIYRYVAALLAEQEEEEAVMLLLAA